MGLWPAVYSLTSAFSHIGSQPGEGRILKASVGLEHCEQTCGHLVEWFCLGYRDKRHEQLLPYVILSHNKNHKPPKAKLME